MPVARMLLADRLEYLRMKGRSLLACLSRISADTRFPRGKSSAPYLPTSSRKYRNDGWYRANASTTGARVRHTEGRRPPRAATVVEHHRQHRGSFPPGSSAPRRNRSWYSSIVCVFRGFMPRPHCWNSCCLMVPRTRGDRPQRLSSGCSTSSNSSVALPHDTTNSLGRSWRLFISWRPESSRLVTTHPLFREVIENR